MPVWYGHNISGSTVWNHVYLRGAEIACLKRLQGTMGYLAAFDTNRP